MKKISDYLDGAAAVAIAGHVNPDGDCVGSCMGMYLYIKENFPKVSADVYLQEPKEVFGFIKDLDQIHTEYEGKSYDLLILLDISSKARIGVAGDCLDHAKKTLCLDHHRTNPGGFTWFHNEPQASSACEVVYRFLEPEKVSKACAEALYTGIAHDTGIFQYSSTSPDTMRIAAELMEKGIDFSKIIDESYYQKKYDENRIMGKTMMESMLLLEGKVAAGVVTTEDMEQYHVGPKDLDGIVNQLRNTEGAEAAIFLYETGENTFKVSLRSKSWMDVSVIAQALGGGGHKKAAGCTVTGSAGEIIDRILRDMEMQILEMGKI